MHPYREIAFLINDVGRLLRTYVDQEARRYGMTRAQWALLCRVEEREGLKQGELAELLDLQPITLTRLVDKLCESGLIERRADATDRRAKRLFLTAKARELLERLHQFGRQIMTPVFAAIPPEGIEALSGNLHVMRESLRGILQTRSEAAE